MGFFSPTAFTRQSMPLPTIPECGACGLYQDCNSPKMKPTGSGRLKVLIVAEAPGRTEDREGVQLIGNAGQELERLLRRIRVNLREDCWLTNAIICHPKDGEGKNRKPTPDEIRWCRPNLVNTIEELKPNVIIPLGETAVRSVVSLAWKDGEVKDIGTWLGWTIPSQKLNAWICPTFHPSYLLRVRDEHRDGGVSEMFTLRHLRAAFDLAGKKPWMEVPDLEAQCKVIMDDKEASREIDSFWDEGVPTAFDFETTTLKPDGPNAEILCCSISDGERAIAYPWIGTAIESTRQFLQSEVPKISANLRFEERWARAKLKIAVNNWYHDTVLGAHWLDCRHGICGLKFQAFVLLGMPDYNSHLDAYIAAADDGGNSTNRLKEVEPATLLLYCAIDSMLEVLVAEKQLRRIVHGEEE